MNRRCDDSNYAIIRLNAQRGDGWAVIGRPSGAIALGEDGKLLMRLEKHAAEGLVEQLNRRHVPAAAAQSPAQWRFSA